MSEPRKPPLANKKSATPKPLWHEKSMMLFRLGFLRDQDRSNVERIEARWKLYQSSVTQKTARSGKPPPTQKAA